MICLLNDKFQSNSTPNIPLRRQNKREFFLPQIEYQSPICARTP